MMFMDILLLSHKMGGSYAAVFYFLRGENYFLLLDIVAKCTDDKSFNSSINY